MFGIAALVLAGCHYPQYVEDPGDLWAPGDPTEKEYVITGQANRVVAKLAEIGWQGEWIEFAQDSGADDGTLAALKVAREAGRVRFHGLILRDASRCSSAALCEVMNLPGLTSVLLFGARFDAEAEPRFADSLASLGLEDATGVSPSLLRHVGESRLAALSFTVRKGMTSDLTLFRLRSRCGDLRYDLIPEDSAAREELFRAVAQLRQHGELRPYFWYDEQRAAHALPDTRQHESSPHGIPSPGP